METSRRTFLQAAGSLGAAILGAGEARTLTAAEKPGTIESAVQTELFLDNELIEASPGVSRRLHPAKKHLLNPVVRCDRWCEGEYLEPYTTLYDEDEKLFKM